MRTTPPQGLSRLMHVPLRHVFPAARPSPAPARGSVTFRPPVARSLACAESSSFRLRAATGSTTNVSSPPSSQASDLLFQAIHIRSRPGWWLGSEWSRAFSRLLRLLWKFFGSSEPVLKPFSNRPPPAPVKRRASRIRLIMVISKVSRSTLGLALRLPRPPPAQRGRTNA